MVEFIDITKDTNDTYLFAFEIKDTTNKKRLIGYSRVYKPVLDEKSHYKLNYELEIKIDDMLDIKTYFHEVLRQSLYKFINLISSNLEWNKIILAISENKLTTSKQLHNIISNALETEYFKYDKDSHEYHFRLANIKALNIYTTVSRTTSSSRRHKTNATKTLKHSSTSLSHLHNKTLKHKLNKINKHNKLNKINKIKPSRNGYSNGYDKTFVISSGKINGLIYTPIQRYLISSGYKEIDDPNSRPTLLIIDLNEHNKYNTAYFNTQCLIMNKLNDNKEIISNKANLYYNFKRAYPKECDKFMAASWPLMEFVKNPNLRKRIAQDNEVFIVRPAGIGAFSGKDISVVNTPKQLEKAIARTRKYKKVLISKYITNPLLLDGKKCHLRVYYMVSYINGVVNSKVIDFYEVMTALKPYKKGDWGNPDIHDTHGGSSEKVIVWPDDISSISLKNKFMQGYVPKIKSCLDLVTKLVADKIAPYPQALQAYEVFACDFLMLDNGEIILMEINDKVGFNTSTTESTIRLSNLYFDAVINQIIEPVLKSKHSH